jgi:hypothetical protein
VPAGHRPQYLEVRIRGRERPERIAVPDAVEPREELKRFLDRLGPYAQMWIRLDSDEYVRYELIESVSVAAGGE